MVWTHSHKRCSLSCLALDTGLSQSRPATDFSSDWNKHGGMANSSSSGLPSNAAAVGAIGEPVEPAPEIRVKRVKRKSEQIDIDRNIKAAREAMKAAAKAVALAKANQRNEMRRKQRLLKKAAGLSSGDLERIAVMKRCGLFDPTIMMAVPRADAVAAETRNPAELCVSGTQCAVVENNNADHRIDTPIAQAPDRREAEGEDFENEERHDDGDLDDP